MVVAIVGGVGSLINSDLPGDEVAALSDDDNDDDADGGRDEDDDVGRGRGRGADTSKGASSGLVTDKEEGTDKTVTVESEVGRKMADGDDNDDEEEEVVDAEEDEDKGGRCRDE